MKDVSRVLWLCVHSALFEGNDPQCSCTRKKCEHSYTVVCSRLTMLYVAYVLPYVSVEDSTMSQTCCMLLYAVAVVEQLGMYPVV